MCESKVGSLLSGPYDCGPGGFSGHAFSLLYSRPCLRFPFREPFMRTSDQMLALSLYTRLSAAERLAETI
jgi:hypothetical protein